MPSIDQVIRLAPRKEGDSILWEALGEAGFAPLFKKMADTPQSPIYHSEGNVFIHTRLVLEALVGLKEYYLLTEKEQNVVFLSALLHDIGKTICTILKDGEITSPYHTVKGAILARDLLWREFDLAGTKEKQALREAVSLLVKYHSFPTFAPLEKDATRKLLKIASAGELTELFSLKLLYLLSKADVLGRKSVDGDDYLERVECFYMMAEDLGCLEKPFAFSSPFSKRAYFRRQTDWPGDTLYPGTWGEVTMLCGLPGSGKDTFIKKYMPQSQMVSLDGIREELGIGPTEEQGQVIAAFQKVARGLLRSHQPFVFNATNLSRDIRQKQIDLFEKYGAAVKIIYLETSFAEQLQRNAGREAEVPLSAIEKMFSKLEMPEGWEAQAVTWEISERDKK